MRRGFLWLTGLIPLIAAAGCGAPGGITLTGSLQGHTYRDRAGWVIKIPPGWHAVRFSDAKDGITAAGVQLSNVSLPPPVLLRGAPIQANGGVLPTRGVGVVIATDTDPTLTRGPVAVPPLPAPDTPNSWKYWNGGSASAGFDGAPGGPDIESLWFRAGHTSFIACAKIGPKATNSARKAVDAIIESLR